MKLILFVLFFLHFSSCEYLFESEKLGFRRDLLYLVNQERAKGHQCGARYYPPVPAIFWNEKLAQVAYDHCDDVSKHDIEGHTGSDGAGILNRILRSGYQPTFYSEIITHNPLTAQQALDAFMNSPGHCQAIMSPNFLEAGAAMFGNNWAVTFGTRRDN
jgi:uncharacterized protein YkwD